MDISQLVQAITRGLIAVVIIGGCAYAVATGASVPTEAWSLAGIIVGGLFGADAVIKYARARNIK
jgi:hypothetical protein